VIQKQAIWHIAFWIFFIGLNMANIYPYFQNLSFLVVSSLIFLPVSLIGTYFNWWILMPQLLEKRKTVSYILAIILMIILLTFSQRYLCQHHFYPSFWINNFDFFHKGLVMQAASVIKLPILFSIWAYVSLDWYTKSHEAQQKIAKQKSAQLNYLKSQINPHFLFNTLNSLYGLSLEKSGKVPNLILKLSDLMSYSLYQSNSDNIELQNEVDLIRNYISLEQVRFEDRLNVDFKIDPDMDLHQKLAPLLFVPLVENAFKHGAKESTSEAQIQFHLHKDQNHLCFTVKNSIPEDHPSVVKKEGGLGLKNLRKRLEILYPEKYNLTTEKIENYYLAELKIDTHV